MNIGILTFNKKFYIKLLQLGPYRRLPTKRRFTKSAIGLCYIKYLWSINRVIVCFSPSVAKCSHQNKIIVYIKFFFIAR